MRYIVILFISSFFLSGCHDSKNGGGDNEKTGPRPKLLFFGEVSPNLERKINEMAEQRRQELKNKKPSTENKFPVHEDKKEYLNAVLLFQEVLNKRQTFLGQIAPDGPYTKKIKILASIKKGLPFEQYFQKVFAYLDELADGNEADAETIIVKAQQEASERKDITDISQKLRTEVQHMMKGAALSDFIEARVHLLTELRNASETKLADRLEWLEPSDNEQLRKFGFLLKGWLTIEAQRL
jgi:hypothetical protein